MTDAVPHAAPTHAARGKDGACVKRHHSHNVAEIPSAAGTSVVTRRVCARIVGEKAPNARVT